MPPTWLRCSVLIVALKEESLHVVRKLSSDFVAGVDVGETCMVASSFEAIEDMYEIFFASREYHHHTEADSCVSLLGRESSSIRHAEMPGGAIDSNMEAGRKPAIEQENASSMVRVFRLRPPCSPFE